MNALKFAFRQLLKNPGFTAVAVLTRGIGGACRLPARHARTQPIREYGDNSPIASRNDVHVTTSFACNCDPPVHGRCSCSISDCCAVWGGTYPWSLGRLRVTPSGWLCVTELRAFVV